LGSLHESSGDVNILAGSLEIAVSVHAQYRFGQNSPERVARRHPPSSCNAFATDTFSSFLYIWIQFDVEILILRFTKIILN